MKEALTTKLLAIALPAVAAGLLVGVVSGLFGIGGGVLMIPVFRFAFGFDVHQAVASSLFVIPITAAAGLFVHVRQHTLRPGLGVLFGASGALASYFGAQLSHLSPSWLVALSASVLIAYSGARMVGSSHVLGRFFERRHKSPGQTPDLTSEDLQREGGGPDPAASGSECNHVQTASGSADAATAVAPDNTPAAAAAAARPRPKLDARTAVTALAFGLLAGLLAGFSGLGGAFLIVPILSIRFGLSVQEASATSLLAVLILAMPGLAGHLAAGQVQILPALMLAAGSVPGAMIGARVARFLPEAGGRAFFGAFLLIVAVALTLKELLL